MKLVSCPGDQRTCVHAFDILASKGKKKKQKSVLNVLTHMQTEELMNNSSN